MRSVVEIYGTLSRADDVYVLGFGGSLRYFPWRVLDNKLVIGVNDMLKIYPIDYHYFSDTGIATRYKDLKISDRTRAIVCQRQAIKLLQRHGFAAMGRVLQSQHATQPTARDSPFLFCRRTVACGGVELAWKLGAGTVYLLGIDGCRPPASYYADGSSSRWRSNMTPKAGLSALRSRVHKEKHAGTLEIVAERVENHQLEIEQRHLDWYTDFCALRGHLDKQENAPRIVNLSPVSIFDQFEIADPYVHFGLEKKDWKLS